MVLGVAPQLAVNVYFFHPMSRRHSGSVHLCASPGWACSAEREASQRLADSYSRSSRSFWAASIYAVRVCRAGRASIRRLPAGGVVSLGAGGGIFTGGEPLSDHGRLTAGDFSHIFMQNWHAFFRWSNVDRVLRVCSLERTARCRREHWAAGCMDGAARVAGTSGCPGSDDARCASGWAGLDRFAAACSATMPMSPLLIGAICIAAVALVCAAAQQPTKTGSFRCISLLPCSFRSCWRVMARTEGLRLGLLEMAALLSVVARLAKLRALAHIAVLAYLSVVLLSAICLASSATIAGPWPARLEPRASAHQRLRQAGRNSTSSSGCFALPMNYLPSFLGFIIASRRHGSLRRALACAHKLDPCLFSPRGRGWSIAASHQPGRRAADAHATQPQAPAGSLHH